ncbi:MAG: MFS transporter [Gemmatimonadota bacterium]
MAGFGFGALIWIKLTGGLRFGPVDLTPGWEGLYGAGWSVNDIFTLYGVLFAVLVGLGSLVMVNPPPGWAPADWTPQEATANSGGVEFTPGEMVQSPQFWSLFTIFVGGSEAGLYLGATLIGFNFGGNFALFPAATADLFGNNSMGVNYPWVFMAYGVGGVLGPLLGGIMGDSGAWAYAFIPAGIACLAAAALAMTLRPPVRASSQETASPGLPVRA